MTTNRLASVCALLALGLLLGSPPAAHSLAEPAAPPTSLQVVRVFYLPALPLKEALRLLRSPLGIRSAAAIEERRALVVADSAEQVQRAEALLRERDVALRAVEPNAPLDLEALESAPQVGREFPTDAAESATALTLLRGIYRLRELHTLADGRGVGARAAEPLLDASEALLRELGLLVEPAAGG